MPQETVSLKIEKGKTEDFRQYILNRLTGQFEDVKSEYEVLRWRGQGLTVVVYSSMKVVLQGDRNEIEKLSDFFDLTKPSVIEKKYENSIGFDEAGKGEFFGPLVLAGCFPRQDEYKRLREIGVQDSKKVSDKRVFELEPIIKECSEFEVRRIEPDELSDKWTMSSNLSKIMSWEYAVLIDKLTKPSLKTDHKKPVVIIDKFTSITNRITQDLSEIRPEFNMEIVQEERAEKYLCVACASILARANYLHWLEEVEKRLSDKLGAEFKLLRGYAGLKQFGKDFIKQFGREEFNLISKRFFKTYQEVTSSFF